MSKVFIISAILAVVEARFGQEQLPVAAVQGLGAFGNPGEAGSLSGQVPGVLLAAASPCAKLELADLIVSTLGNDDAVILAAIGLVAAEQNFNPFAVSIPNICGQANLPATEALRGIVPLVDPAVLGSDVENANSALSVQTPFNAVGLSVAEVIIAQGFTNFTIEGVAVDAGAGAGAGNDNAAGDVAADAPVVDCANVAAPVAAPAADDAADDAANVDTGAADFGLCDPSISFELGRPGRQADEGTFLPIDALVAQGQQDALNPNIITNRVCDQLINVCEANDAAIALCEDAQAQVEASGDRSAAVADVFNGLLGF